MPTAHNIRAVFEELKKRSMHYILLSADPTETVIHMLEEEFHIGDRRSARISRFSVAVRFG